jgi:hypothetical protein
MWRDFLLARTPLGIVAAVFNRRIFPHVTFLLRLQATILVGAEHHMEWGYSGYKPLLRYRSALCALRSALCALRSALCALRSALCALQ